MAFAPACKVPSPDRQRSGSTLLTSSRTERAAIRQARTTIVLHPLLQVRYDIQHCFWPSAPPHLSQPDYILLPGACSFSQCLGSPGSKDSAPENLVVICHQPQNRQVSTPYKPNHHMQPARLLDLFNLFWCTVTSLQKAIA